jgi:AraC-like DNA-binding protein
MDVKLERDLVINKLPLFQENHKKTFIITYIMKAGGVKVRDTMFNKRILSKPGKNLLFTGDDSGVAIELPAGDSFKAISLSVSRQWLIQEFGSTNQSYYDLIDKLCENENNGIFLESACLQEMKALSEIDNQVNSDSANFLAIKAKVFTLVSHFFLNKFNKAKESDKRGENDLYTAKMLKVESILLGHLEMKLPSLKSIAREMAISVSTLKRHFKVIFGKNIYEYYLELKMDHAKRMLIENPFSVNEVASKLDYGKVSAFINIFKKHFGECPGKIRKKVA